jgi:hypothetical protein
MLLWVLPAAQAAETLYWSNYSSDSLAFANLNGSGGGPFDTAGQNVTGSEGLAIDSVTGRLYWSNFTTGPGSTGGIRFAGLSGGDGGQLNAGGATINEPSGIAIDPTTRTIFWSNYDGGVGNEGVISWARLDGSASGDLNTSGATVKDPGQVAIDTLHGRLYWANYGNDTISFANLDNSGGGGNLDLSGATPPSTITGLAINPGAGQIYWIDNDGEHISHANLTGGGGGDFDLSGATFKDAYGMAFDPASGRIYWGNYGTGTVRTAAFSFVGIGGGGSNIDIASAPVDGPQNPIILKGPSGTGAPAIGRSPTSRTLLSCSQGSWAADAAGSFVYQAPRTYAYQWTLNGVAIAGATATTYTAATAGAYACAVTGANANGSATQVSAPVQINAAKLVLSAKTHKAGAKAGHAGSFAFKVTNKGDLTSKGARLCVKLTKVERQDLKAPKCKSLGSIAGGKKRSVKLRVKTDDSAEGSYKLTFRVRGKGAGKAVKAKLAVR